MSFVPPTPELDRRLLPIVKSTGLRSKWLVIPSEHRVASSLSVKDVEHAMRAKAQGKKEIYRNLLERSATFNRTTPEKSGQFFEDHLIDE